MNLSDLMHSGVKRKTKREVFLEQIEKIVPFALWTKLIEPHYYVKRADGRGRPPIGIGKMLRMYLLQIWFNLSDELLEDSIYESNSMQRFVGIDLMSESVPDATTLLLFRQMLTENGLQQKMMTELTELLTKNKIMMTKGTIVDATIIQAPSSTKNEKKERDPYMKSVKKGNNWYFGCKAHIGIDKKSGLVHTVVTTPANIHDSAVAPQLTHGKEKEVYGDSGYLGIDKKIRHAKCRIVKRLSTINKITDETKRAKAKAFETKKCSVRATVEHAFHIIKNIFGFRRIRYRGEAKNDSLFQMLFACVNLYKLARQGRSLFSGVHLA